MAYLHLRPPEDLQEAREVLERLVSALATLEEPEPLC